MKTKILVIVGLAIALIATGLWFNNRKKASDDYEALNQILSIDVKPEKCLWEVHKLGKGRSVIGPTDYSYIVFFKYNSNDIVSFRKKIQATCKRTNYLQEDISVKVPTMRDCDLWEIKEEINEINTYDPDSIEFYTIEGGGLNGIYGDISITKKNTVIMFLFTM